MSRVIDRTGEVGFNNLGSEMIISEYRNNKDIDVYFPQYKWTSRNKRYKSFKEGRIKCPYEPSIYKVACLGEGQYKKRINKKDTRVYLAWESMLRSCYSDTIQNYKYYGGQGYKVDEEWLNFQNYAKWHEQHRYDIKGHTIVVSYKLFCEDKVISPNTSVFAPITLIALLLRHGLSTQRHDDGIYYYGSMTYTHLNGEKESIYDSSKSKEKSRIMYKENKERIVRELAEEYKDYIPTKLYDYMKNFVLDVEDIRVLSEGGNN